jgi:hypothetical protein
MPGVLCDINFCYLLKRHPFEWKISQDLCGHFHLFTFGLSFDYLVTLEAQAIPCTVQLV